MRVTAVHIRNVLGIAELDVAPGQITKVGGGNGTGKSSLLAALQAGIGGGSLANLKRVGSEDDPEVVIVLDEGRYRVERKGDKVRVRERVGDSAAYEDVRRPQAFLDALYDGAMANPVTFLTAHPNTRTDLLLEALPLQLDRDALVAAIGPAWPEGRVLPEGHPLAVVSAARQVLFEERTGVNRSAKDKDASAYELQKALPAEIPADPAAALLEAGTARDDLFKKVAAKRSEAEVAHQRATEKATASYEQAVEVISATFKATAAKIRAELERKMAALREETEKLVAAEKAIAEEAIAKEDEGVSRIQEEAAQARAEAYALADALQPDLQAAEHRVAELTALARNVTRLQEQKRLADRFQTEAASLQAKAAELTEAIARVDVFKAQLLKDLPIPGLELRGRDIFINGVPWEQVNTAARVKVAVTVARLRARAQLPLLFLDGAESLDTEHFKLLEEELRAAGMQAIVASVEDGPLTIEGKDAPRGEPATVLAMPPPTTPAPRRGRRVLAE